MGQWSYLYIEQKFETSPQVKLKNKLKKLKYAQEGKMTITNAYFMDLWQKNQKQSAS